jgi:carnosine N-methyltransferase
VKTRYAQNVNSMLQCEYNSVYFVCRRPREHTDRINHTHNSESNGAQEQEN